MSDATAYNEQLQQRETLSRIDRQIAETTKFQQESIKLAAEAAKLGRERWLAPFLAAASLGAACGALVIAYANIAHH